VNLPIIIKCTCIKGGVRFWYDRISGGMCTLQVELLVTYEGSRFAVSDLRLLMDTFLLVELNGSWRRLFSKVKKHIIWSVLKSVTGMQVRGLNSTH